MDGVRYTGSQHPRHLLSSNTTLTAVPLKSSGCCLHLKPAEEEVQLPLAAATAVHAHGAACVSHHTETSKKEGIPFRAWVRSTQEWSAGLQQAWQIPGSLTHGRTDTLYVGHRHR